MRTFFTTPQNKIDALKVTLTVAAVFFILAVTHFFFILATSGVGSDILSSGVKTPSPPTPQERMHMLDTLAASSAQATSPSGASTSAGVEVHAASVSAPVAPDSQGTEHVPVQDAVSQQRLKVLNGL